MVTSSSSDTVVTLLGDERFRGARTLVPTSPLSPYALLTYGHYAHTVVRAELRSTGSQTRDCLRVFIAAMANDNRGLLHGLHAWLPAHMNCFVRLATRPSCNL